MCDTLLATPDNTVEHTMLFGKNSDRQRNEAQSVEIFPRADYARDVQLTCTYLTITQAPHTHALLLCRPFWMWGGEMGANEHGVVVGNEGLHARAPAPEEKAFTGMDLLRLALERARTAAEALSVVTALLERHGQGGDCGHLTPNYYNNGFLIADSTEAYVLETVGREWLVERVRSVRALSNVYSVGQHPASVSSGLPVLVRDSGWSLDAEPNYADAITHPHREHIGQAGARRARSTSLLQSRDTKLTTADMIRILRDHGPSDKCHAHWNPEHAENISLCMHAGADDRPGQTAGSMVSQIFKADAVHWVTGTAAPCTSIFKPVLLDVPVPSHGPRPSDHFDPRTLWWKHELLHRAAVSGDLAKFLNDICQERDELEAVFHTRIHAVLSGGSFAERSYVVAECWAEATEAETRWYARMNKAGRPGVIPYYAAWSRMNRIAGIDDT